MHGKVGENLGFGEGVEGLRMMGRVRRCGVLLSLNLPNGTCINTRPLINGEPLLAHSRKDLRPRRNTHAFSVRPFGNALLGYAAAKPNNHRVDKTSGY